MELVNEMQAADAQLAAGEVSGAGGARAAAHAGADAGAVCAVSCGRVVGRAGRRRQRSCARRGRRAIPQLAKEDEIEIPVQANGKLMTVMRVAADASGEAIESAALADEKVQARLAGKTVAKVIVVPGKLVNLVLRPSDKDPSPGPVATTTVAGTPGVK